MAIIHAAYMATGDFVFPRVLLLAVIAAIGLVVLVILVITLFVWGCSDRSRQRNGRGDPPRATEHQQNSFGDSD